MEHYNNVTKGKGGVVPRYMHEEDDEEDSDMMAYERASDFVMDLVMDQGGYRMMDRDEDGYEDGDEVGRWDQEGTRLHEIRALCRLVSISLDTVVYNDAKSVVIGGTAGCRYDSHRCHQWRHHCNSRFSVPLYIPWNTWYDFIKWKHFACYRRFVRGIQRWPVVNSPHKGQWHGALMFSLICAWTKGCANNRDAGDLRCHTAFIMVSL